MRILQTNLQTAFKPLFGVKNAYKNSWRETHIEHNYGEIINRQREDCPPEHPDLDSCSYHEDLKACRDYANKLKRPDFSSSEAEIREWNEYSKYRTKR